jgi:hypothetical protein
MPLFRRILLSLVTGIALAGPASAGAQSPYTPAPSPTPGAAPLPVSIELPSRRLLRGAPVTGRVRDAAGAAVAGAPVLLVARLFGATGPSYPVALTRTAADGGFEVVIGGNSWEVTAGIPDPAYAATPRTVDLISPLSVSAAGPKRLLRNGDRLRITGRVAGAGGLVTGKVVAVQALIRGRWGTVGRVKADAAGRVVWRYRLRNTSRRSAYRFRLLVPRVAGQPWRAVASRRLIVQARP